MEFHVYWLLKSSCFELSGDGNTVFFNLKCWLNDDIYWLLKSSCFELFGGGKYGSFLSESWWKDDIYWLLKMSCFEVFGDGKYGLFWAKKLIERWYLLGLFEIFLILQDLGNMVFLAVFCIGFIDFMLQGKSLLDYTNLFSPNEYEKY